MTTPAADGQSQPQFSEQEEAALALYDRLQELRLEIAIINAQARLQDGTATQEADIDRTVMLEARGRYMLRNQVIESVLVANPILKAVHMGRDASLVEKDLLPSVEKRDEVGIDIAKQASSMALVHADLVNVQSDMIRVSRRNVNLASQIIEIAGQISQKKSAQLKDPVTQREVEKLERDVKKSKQRWRIIKGVASGVVVGSGVDWGRDEHLCGLVLDPEEDET